MHADKESIAWRRIWVGRRVPAFWAARRDSGHWTDAGGLLPGVADDRYKVALRLHLPKGPGWIWRHILNDW